MQPPACEGNPVSWVHLSSFHWVYPVFCAWHKHTVLAVSAFAKYAFLSLCAVIRHIYCEKIGAE